MAAKHGTFLNPFVHGPHRPPALLYSFLFLIARHTISEFQSLRVLFPFRRLRFDHIRFSHKSPYRKGGFRGILFFYSDPCTNDGLLKHATEDADPGNSFDVGKGRCQNRGVT
jgi:hypothetical protein